MHMDGQDIPKNAEAAVKWLRLAADQRDEEAQESWEYLVTSRTLSS